MGKKRIFELAKDYGVKSTEIIEALAKHNITNKTNFSGVDDNDIAIISATFRKKPAESKPAKPQPAAQPEKPKPAPAPAKPKTEKPERPSMIVKPVIMTVETNAEGKSTITHNALQNNKTAPADVKPAGPAAPQKPANGQPQPANNDGKNKYRNAPNNKALLNKDAKNEKPSADARLANAPATNADRNRNLNQNQNRNQQNRPMNQQGMNSRPAQGQNRDFSRQGGFNKDRSGQGQNRDFNRQGGFNKDKDAGQGSKFGANRQGNRGNAAPKKQTGGLDDIRRGK